MMDERSRSRSFGRGRSPTPRDRSFSRGRDGLSRSDDGRSRSPGGLSRSPGGPSRSLDRSPGVIFVEKLTRNVREEHLREIFGQYGEIRDFEMPMNHRFRTNKGMARITFASHDSAHKAMAHMHAGQLDGAHLHISLLLPREAFSVSPPPSRTEAARLDRLNAPPPRGPPPRGPREAPGRFRSPSPRRGPSPYGRYSRGYRSPPPGGDGFRRGRSYTRSRSRSPARNYSRSRSRSWSGSSRSLSRSPPPRREVYRRRDSPPPRSTGRGGGGGGGRRRRSPSYSSYESRSRSRSRSRSLSRGRYDRRRR